MVDPVVFARRERAFKAFERHGVRTAANLLGAHVPFSTTIALFMEGTIRQAGPNERAAMTYELAKGVA